MTTERQQKKSTPGLIARYVPIVHWLPRYKRAWLTGDMVAGLSVWALMVPLVLGIGASAIFDLSAQGVAVVGKVPRGLPIPAIPDISLITKNFGLILSGAIGVLLVGFSESLAAARQYAAKYHYDIDINQEMLAQGMANITSDMKRVGVEIHLARTKHEVKELLVKDGVDQAIGHDHIHYKVMDAVRWFHRKDQPLEGKAH